MSDPCIREELMNANKRATRVTKQRALKIFGSQAIDTKKGLIMLNKYEKTIFSDARDPGDLNVLEYCVGT